MQLERMPASPGREGQVATLPPRLRASARTNRAVTKWPPLALTRAKKKPAAATPHRLGTHLC